VDYQTIRQKLLERPVTVRGKRYYVAETDLLLDEAQVIAHARMRADARSDPMNPPKNQAFIDKRQRLLAISRNGRIVRWNAGLTLTYAIDESTFAKAEYQTVRANMRDATAAWAGVCGIRFEHREGQDHAGGTATRDALFTVSKTDAGGEFIAAAFFPTDPPDRRAVVIDPSYFAPALGFDTVGVLRHELGHVLGFRHEHIREGAPAGCLHEELEDTTAVTRYDPQSVMHYLCGGLGSPELQLTDVDQEGAKVIYGPPFTTFEMVS
jgi:hypothetical protein